MTSISIKEYEDEITDSRLVLHISGKNITDTIVNTYRRVILTLIPIYIFNKIHFTKNTSVFNNNYLKLRLKNLPILSIKTDDSIFVPISVKKDDDEDNIELQDNIEYDTTKALNSSSLNQLTMYLNKKNETNEIISVTTNDAKFYLAEKNIENPYKNKIQLIKLQPNQEINMTCITDKNIEDYDSLYSAVSICCFTKNKENDYDFVIESRGQLTEFEIINIAFDNIINLLDKFYKLIPDVKDTEGKISFSNFDHTIGNIISEGLQNHKDVDFAGYAMNHPLENKIVITFRLNSSTLKAISKDVISNYKKVFKEFNSKVQKLSK